MTDGKNINLKNLLLNDKDNLSYTSKVKMNSNEQKLSSSQTEFRSIMRLLDDDAQFVRSAIKDKLASYGENVGKIIAKNNLTPTAQEQKLLAEILVDERRNWLANWWREWVQKQSFSLESEADSLEAGFAILSDYLSNSLGRTERLSILLDDLATQISFNKGFKKDSMTNFEQMNFIADFLFGSGMFTPATGEFPLEGDLASAIETKKGSPIALVAIYVLVASRFGLSVEMCNFPRHCFAKITEKDENFNTNICLIDCYNGGRFYTPEIIANYYPHISLEIASVINSKFTNREIFQRVFKNLYRHFCEIDDKAEYLFLGTLYQMTATQGLN